MRTINYTNQFKKDFKLIQKQNKDLEKIKTVIAKLAAGEVPGEKFKDHALQGNYAGTGPAFRGLSRPAGLPDRGKDQRAAGGAAGGGGWDGFVAHPPPGSRGGTRPQR